MLRYKTRILILLLCASLPLLGQSKKPRNLVTFDYQPFHFGYSVGLFTMHYHMSPPAGSDYLLAVKMHPGINLNLITNFRLNNNLDLRFLPGMQFGQRDVTVIDKSSSTPTPPFSIDGVFIDLPFLLKYRSERVNNFAPYLIAGINPRVDLLGSRLEGFTRGERLSKAIDVYPELGVGIDFYLQKVKVAAELKFSVGTFNVYNQPDTSDPFSVSYYHFIHGVSTMLSRMVIFAIHVE
ncbi:MAG: outer membrane beta-barrel protein [Bacteroidales bacterium]